MVSFTCDLISNDYAALQIIRRKLKKRRSSAKEPKDASSKGMQKSMYFM